MGLQLKINFFQHSGGNIATYFKDYSQLLIFDILNEPQGVLGDWNNGTLPTQTSAIALTRQINEVGYRAIRRSGGLNMSRVFMIEPNGYGNQSTLKIVYPSKFTITGIGNDKFLSFQVHTYDPWSFCGENGNNKNYPGKDSIMNWLLEVSAHSKKLNVPVNYGEFGAGRADNQSDRSANIIKEYYYIIRSTCEKQKMSSTLWDDRGWFGLITNDISELKFIYRIVPLMMKP